MKSSTGRRRHVAILFGENNVGGRKTLACDGFKETEAPISSAINGIVYLFDGITSDAPARADAVGLYDYDTVQELQSRLCGIIEATSNDKTQREALKKLIVDELFDMYHDRRRLFEYEYGRLQSRAESGDSSSD